MNDNGDVVGWTANGSVSTGFVWTRGAMTSAASSPSFRDAQGVLYRNNSLIDIDTSAPSMFAHSITNSGIMVGD